MTTDTQLNFLPTDTPTTPSIPSDISPRVVELARIIDRLAPGQHLIVIHKDDIRAKDWEVEILTVQHSRSLTLPKKLNRT